jgi:hypothetical protein
MNRYNAIAFQQATAGIAGWVSILIAKWLMTSFGVWVPLYIGLGIIFLVILLVQFMPTNEAFNDEEDYSSWYQACFGRLRETFKFLGSAKMGIWLLISTYIVSSAYPQLVDNSLFEQYISTRFKNSIAKVSKTCLPENES